MSRSSTSESVVDEVESKLLQICGELVEMHKLIKIDKLYNIARRELPHDSSVIVKSILHLQEKCIIKPNSRLLRPELLENETRREIYSHLSRSPGLTFNQIKKLMGRGTKVLLWHVEVLKEFGCVWTMAFDEKSIALFPASIDPGEWGEQSLFFFHLFTKPRTKQLLDALCSNESLQVVELAALLGITRPAVEYQCKKLQDAGIIDDFIDKSDGFKHYFIPGREKEKILVVKDYLIT